MKTRVRYYIIAVCATLILLLGGGYYLTTKTLWSKAASVATYKNEIISANYIKQFAQIMFSSYESSRADILLFQSFFIKKEGEVDFIEFIEQAARAQGLDVSIDTVSIDSPKNVNVYNMEYFILNFTVKGSWSQVFNFSRMLQVLPYAHNIQAVNLIHEGGSENNTSKTSVWKGVYTIKVLKKK